MKRQRAIVIGGSIAGMCAAGAIANFFDEVWIFDRDSLPDTTVPRTGAPQGRHPHGLLAGGLKAMVELFPDIMESLEKAGGRLVDFGIAVRYEMPYYAQLAPVELGITGYAASRPLIEAVIRSKVKAIDNVRVLGATRVNAINIDHVTRRVSSVDYSQEGLENVTLPADIVIDATGRGRLTLELLMKTGRAAVEETVIDIGLRIASGIFSLPKDFSYETVAVFTPARAPDQTRSGIMLWREDGNWSIALVDRFGEIPPTDLTGFVNFSSSLPTSTINSALRRSKAESQIVEYAFDKSIRRHFEKIEDFPEGVFPIGDSICRFNPVYGQGMTVAAQEACVLRRLFTTEQSTEVGQLGPRYFEAIQPLIDSAWEMSATPDLFFPATAGYRPATIRETMDYQGKLLQAASKDTSLYKLHIEAINLLKPSTVLREQDIVQRVLSIA